MTGCPASISGPRDARRMALPSRASDSPAPPEPPDRHASPDHRVRETRRAACSVWRRPAPDIAVRAPRPGQQESSALTTGRTGWNKGGHERCSRGPPDAADVAPAATRRFARRRDAEGDGGPVISVSQSSLILLIAAAVSFALNRLLAPLLARYAVAQPNARSSHTQPTPQGGGIAVVVGADIPGAARRRRRCPGRRARSAELAALWPLAAAVLLLAATRAPRDDMEFHLSVAPRFLAQFIAVGLVVAALPAEARIVPLLPWWVERAVLFLAGVYAVNVVNFMDGLDWMTVAEVVPVTGGLWGLCRSAGALTPRGGPPSSVALVRRDHRLCAVQSTGRQALSRRCRQPADRPDAVLAAAATCRQRPSRGGAVWLPLYYIADATCHAGPLRLARGENVLRAHRMHFYQRATDRGYLGHRQWSRASSCAQCRAGLPWRSASLTVRPSTAWARICSRWRSAAWLVAGAAHPLRARQPLSRGRRTVFDTRTPASTAAARAAGRAAIPHAQLRPRAVEPPAGLLDPQPHGRHQRGQQPRHQVIAVPVGVADAGAVLEQGRERDQPQPRIEPPAEEPDPHEGRDRRRVERDRGVDVAGAGQPPGELLDRRDHVVARQVQMQDIGCRLEILRRRHHQGLRLAHIVGEQHGRVPEHPVVQRRHARAPRKPAKIAAARARWRRWSANRMRTQHHHAARQRHVGPHEGAERTISSAPHECAGATGGSSASSARGMSATRPASSRI